MGRRDNLKILTTAILVVLLLSSFIFAFIYRNEIYQKLQTIGKNREVEMVDREIERENPKIPAPKENFSHAETKESLEDRSKLPELPSLDDMEPESDHPRSVSVAASTKTKEKMDPAARLQDKLDQVEESIAPKEDLKKTKKTPAKEEVVSEGLESTPSTKQPKLETKDSVKPNQKADSKVVSSSKAEPKQTRTKKYNSISEKKQSKKVKKTYHTQKPSKTKDTGEVTSSSLEVRMRNVEQKLATQNDRNEKRFVEIERRIDSLEKALAK